MCGGKDDVPDVQVLLSKLQTSRSAHALIILRLCRPMPTAPADVVALPDVLVKCDETTNDLSHSQRKIQ